MHVEIWSDIACPWCYVGKRRFEHALAEFEHRDGLEIVWRSFELDPAAPPHHGVPAVELLAKKYRVPVEQARTMNARLQGEGAKEGLALDLERVQVGNTFDAHRLIHFAAAAGRRDEVVERLFAAYLTHGEVVSDPAVLVRIAAEAGLDADAARAALESGAHADAVRADEARARAFGISGVPFFAIDERYGVSGAQPPEVILDALRRAWSESSPAPVAAAAGEGCEDGSCAI